MCIADTPSIGKQRKHEASLSPRKSPGSIFPSKSCSGKALVEDRGATNAVVILSLGQIFTFVLLSSAVSFGFGQLVATKIGYFEKAVFEWDTIWDFHNSLETPPSLTTFKSSNYTGKGFSTRNVYTSSSFFADIEDKNKCSFDQEICLKADNEKGKDEVPIEDMEGVDGGNREPHGEHLLVDIVNVDAEFLDSETRLAHATIELIQQSTKDLLSYHCHRLMPSGFSCVGILTGGHVTFRTWPSKGVITLDIFTNGDASLLPSIPIIQDLFGISNESIERIHDGFSSQQQPSLRWSRKLRGFPEKNRETDNLVDDVDMEAMLGTMGIEKEFVISVETDFQKIDIYDIITLFNERDRVVYLDGVMQSKSLGEVAYHEALVHPAMFSHDNPKRVAIIGGGEGATLREVLKHKTVEKVVMIEIDELMVNVSRTYLPEWSDCGNLASSKPSCFDDPRAEVYFEDAISWFIKRFNSDAKEENFDIIIMDALDPNSVVEFSDFLYNNDEFTGALSNALGDTGVFIAQIGEMDDYNDPPDIYDNDLSGTFIEGLIDAGFESVTQYHESHGGFSSPWTFLVAMKDQASRSNWLASEAELNLSIRKRIMPTKTGESSLLYFDGATMKDYQFPSRVVEQVWCVENPEKCDEQHGFDPEVPNLPRSLFEVDSSTVAEGGRGVFATEGVSRGTHIGLEECVQGMFIPPKTNDLLDVTAEQFPGNAYLECLSHGYVNGYGWQDSFYGEPASGVDPGIFTFVNHGCNGSYNVGTKLNETESTIELGQGPSGIYDDTADEYDPFRERHFPHWECGQFRALRDIKAGEELFDNYLVFGGGDDEDDWESNLRELKNMCSGGVGSVSKYEKESTK